MDTVDQETLSPDFYSNTPTEQCKAWLLKKFTDRGWKFGSNPSVIECEEIHHAVCHSESLGDVNGFWYMNHSLFSARHFDSCELPGVNGCQDGENLTEFIDREPQFEMDYSGNGEIATVETWQLQDEETDPKELEAAKAKISKVFGPKILALIPQKDDLFNGRTFIPQYLSIRVGNWPERKSVVTKLYYPFTLSSETLPKLDALFNEIKKILNTNEAIDIKGFGKFKMRKLRVPENNQAFAPSFMPDRKFNEAINNPEVSDIPLECDGTLSEQIRDPEFLKEFSSLLSHLQNTEKASFLVPNFLQMSLEEFPGYEGRNPVTGKVIAVPSKKMPFIKFKR